MYHVTQEKVSKSEKNYIVDFLQIDQILGDITNVGFIKRFAGHFILLKRRILLECEIQLLDEKRAQDIISYVEHTTDKKEETSSVTIHPRLINKAYSLKEHKIFKRDRMQFLNHNTWS